MTTTPPVTNTQKQTALKAVPGSLVTPKATPKDATVQQKRPIAATPKVTPNEAVQHQELTQKSLAQGTGHAVQVKLTIDISCTQSSN